MSPSLISEKSYNIVMENKEKLNATIEDNRDYDFDFFGFKTLERSYLLKVNDKVVEDSTYVYEFQLDYTEMIIKVLFQVITE